MMMQPQATIIVVPRERFSHSERSLDNIYENTTCPFKLIYISGGSPGPIRRRLEDASQRKGFKLVHQDRYLSPNQARNLGVEHADTKYVVFIDNDALVSPGWLEALVDCAEATGAWAVGPLYFIGEFEKRIIHMAGATVHFREEEGKRVLYEEQYHLNSPASAVDVPLQRRACGHLEFHCLLARTDVFEKLGPLDEQLLSVHEHIDFCMAIRQAGGSVYLEPNASTTYIPPPPGQWWDLPFFMLRWSEEWNLLTALRFKEKWGVSSIRHVSDKSDGELEDTIVRFARGHRRLMTGLRVSEGDEDRPRSPLEHAELVIAMFQSVDRDIFDLVVEVDEQPSRSITGLGPHTVLNVLREALKDSQGQRIRARPCAPKQAQPALIRVDKVTRETWRKLQPIVFLTVETQPDAYQCWAAVDRSNWRSAAALRRLARPNEEAGAEAYALLAESRDAEGHRIRLVEANTGLVNTIARLEAKGALPFLQEGFMY